MSCCCQRANVFEKSLNYSSPAHGGWGVVKIGHLVPESYQLFVSPAACGRHGALAAAMENRKNRVSYLFLREEEIVSGGYEQQIVDGACELLEHLASRKRMPKVLMIFVSCIDDLLGTDHDALIAELSEKYPQVRFIFCHMNPTSTDTKIPPGVNIQNKIYSVLDVAKEKDRGVNIIGNLSPLRENGELFRVLKDMGASEVRHISEYTTYEDYQTMARSCLNLVVAPTGKYACEQMKKKHGIPMEMVLTTFRLDRIRDAYERIAEQLGSACPELSHYEAACEKAMRETAKALDGMPVIIDGEAIQRPFDLAKSLLEHGINVTHVFEQNVLPMDKKNYEWLVEHHPEVEILQPQNPKATVFEKLEGESLAIGYSAAYITGAAHVLDLGGQHGLYGYQGVLDLMQMMRQAVTEKADLKKIIDDAVLVV